MIELTKIALSTGYSNVVESRFSRGEDLLTHLLKMHNKRTNLHELQFAIRINSRITINIFTLSDDRALLR